MQYTYYYILYVKLLISHSQLVNWNEKKYHYMHFKNYKKGWGKTQHYINLKNKLIIQYYVKYKFITIIKLY